MLLDKLFHLIWLVFLNKYICFFIFSVHIHSYFCSVAICTISFLIIFNMRIIKASLKRSKCHATVEMHNVSDFLFREAELLICHHQLFWTTKKKKRIFVKKASCRMYTTKYYWGMQYEQISPAY